MGNIDLFGKALDIIKEVEETHALRVLKEFLTDCKEAGFSEEDISQTRIMMFWMLYQDRLTNFIKNSSNE